MLFKRIPKAKLVRRYIAAGNDKKLKTKIIKKQHKHYSILPYIIFLNDYILSIILCLINL